MIALTALKNVDPTRLAKAATALMDGSYFVTVSQCAQFYLSGCVRGKERSYRVTLTASSAHCECEDSRFHHSHCKHVGMFALTIVRAMQGAREEAGASPFSCVEEARVLPPPNLTLAKVRRDSDARSVAY